MGRSKKICFLIAPIGKAGSDTRKHSDAVLERIINPINALGYHIIRADTISNPGLISKQIIEYIITADLVIADLTDKNPNVFYELALRHTCRKPVIQIIKDGQDIPFDVSDVRTIKFDLESSTSVEKTTNDIILQINSLASNCKVENPISSVFNDLSAEKKYYISNADPTKTILFYQERSELPPLDVQLENTNELWLQFFSGSVTNADKLHNDFFMGKKVKLLLPHPEHDSFSDMCKLFDQPHKKMKDDIIHFTDIVHKDFPNVEVKWYKGILTSCLMIGNPKSKRDLWVRYEILIPYEPSNKRPSFRINNKSASKLTEKTIKSFEKIWGESNPPFA